MKITILGNGGAINDGLPYNAFLAGESVLFEVPPDIMPSLNRFGFNAARIHTVYISHLHADHCFGLPFLLLDIFFKMTKAKTVPLEPIRIFGPSGIGETALSLVGTGLGKEHPVMEWMKKNAVFHILDEKREHPLIADTVSHFYRMKHSFETWGCTVEKGGTVSFAYTADTLWCDSLETMLKRKPANVLVDLNGEADDPVPIHLSEKTLLEKTAEMKIRKTRFWGTHLKCAKKGKTGNLAYVKPGMTIEIG